MSLLQMSLSGAALILFASLIRAAAVNALPKRTFLILWWIVLLRLLVPFSLPAMVPMSPLLGGIGDIMRETRGLFAGAESGEARPPLPPQAETAPPDAGTARQGAGQRDLWLTLIWAADALTAAGAHLASYLRCARELRTSLPVKNGYPDRWLREHNLRRRLEVRSLSGLPTPLTYGLFRPKILMPADFDWRETEKADYILYHEYVHIRRLDTLTKGLAALAVCVHWFNPLVWVFRILFDRDLELACDEDVVRHFGADSRSSYALALIDLEERRTVCAPLHSYFAKNAIEERIKAIMKTKRTTVFTLTAAALIVALAVTAAAAFAASDAGVSIEAVLKGESGFLYAADGTAQPRTIGDIPALFSPDDSSMRIWAYALLDLDGDGEDEAVLEVFGAAGDTGGQLILHRIGGQIYAYKTDYRTLTDLKADGTGAFSDPTGVKEGGICAISSFTESGFALDKISYGSGDGEDWDTFIVDRRPATSEELQYALDLQREKPSPQWTDYVK